MNSSARKRTEQTDSACVTRRVHQAIRELPEHQRELIELAYWSGLSAAEIADRLKIPLGTFRARVRSALGDLSSRLDRNESRGLDRPGR